MEYFTSNKYSWGSAIRLPNTCMELDCENSIFCTPEFAGYEIESYEMNGEKLTLHLLRSFGGDNQSAFNVFVELISDNVVHISSDDEYVSANADFKDKNRWHCISSPATMKVCNGKINDNLIRLRTLPNLSCDTWGHLNKNDKVVVKEKSSSATEIDGESWNWYRVSSNGFPDGWVYGKYLDFID